MRINFLVGMAVIGLSGALAGCAVPTKITGGGWMPGADGGKANFGFNADSCSGNVVGRFNYRDRSYLGVERGGVGMNGDVVEAVQCVPEDLSANVAPGFCAVCVEALSLPVHAALVNYRSTNPWAPGAGQAVACMIDNGQGANSTAADFALVEVISGPFDGYSNTGPVQGNIKEHEC